MGVDKNSKKERRSKQQQLAASVRDILIAGAPGRKEEGAETRFQEITAENFPPWGKKPTDIRPGRHRAADEMHPRRPTPRRSVANMASAKDEETDGLEGSGGSEERHTKEPCEMMS